MSLTMTRPEKGEAMTSLVYSLREALGEQARSEELNLAECLNALGQTMASVLVGAYVPKNREIVLSMLPDLVRGYFPQWEEIYAKHKSDPQ